MSKIIRYDGNLVPFAKNATGTNRTIFGDVTQSDELTANIDNGAYKLGWEIVGPSDKPTLEDFSGAMFTNAQLSAYLHQMGVAEWNDKQEYQIGSIANRAGVLYSCKTADHVSVTPPESDPANWESAIPADLLNTVRIDVASAATVDLTANAPDTRHINITGSNAISAFTVAAGQCYFVRFDASATLVNGVSIVTQRGSDIVANAGDSCIIRSTSADVIEVVCFVRGSGPIGESQTWQDVTGSRSVGVVYTNTTGRPIQLGIFAQTANSHNIDFEINGMQVAGSTGSTTGMSHNFNHIIPEGSTYAISTFTGQVSLNWWEFR